MAKKKITDGLQNSKGKKLASKTQKPPKAKKAAVKDLHPKVSNKDSLTDNIKAPSAKSIKDKGLGKSQRVALNHKLSVAPKRKKK